MIDTSTLKITNAKRWAVAKPTRSSSAFVIAQHLFAAKSRYVAVSQMVQKATGNAIPWWFIAAVHEREASQNWNTQLGQGDPLHEVSRHAPAGRGPFSTWEEGAVDALVHCPPYTAQNRDWSIGGTLAAWVKYNGVLYDGYGRPSPYVWSGTSVYDPPAGPGGKVMVDHGPIESVTDKQMGCAAMLMALMAIDSTIQFGDMPATKPVLVPPASPKAPVTPPAQTGWFASLINAIFRRR